MSKQINERAFELHVEEVLLQRSGWKAGTNAKWDVERALFPETVCAFLEATQPKLWAEMRALHAAGLEKLIIGALVKELDIKGTLHVLRRSTRKTAIRLRRCSPSRHERWCISLPIRTKCI